MLSSLRLSADCKVKADRRICVSSDFAPLYMSFALVAVIVLSDYIKVLHESFDFQIQICDR